MWNRIQQVAKPLEIPLRTGVEEYLNEAWPQALVTLLVTVWVLRFDWHNRSHLNQVLPQSSVEQEEWVTGAAFSLLGLVVAYSAICTLYCIVRGFAIATKRKTFWKGRIHFVNGLAGTLACIAHMFHFIYAPDEKLEDRGIAFWSAILVAFGYGINALIALPLLFTVHGHLSSLVRLLATGLFINLVLIANIIVVTFPGVVWPIYIALPMAIISILYCVAEVILGSMGHKGKDVRGAVSSEKTKNGPFVALFKRGVLPNNNYFDQTVVTRFGFFLGIPPCASWFYMLLNTDLSKIVMVDSSLRRAFVAAMVWSCWQIAVGTLIATLVMRGAIRYYRFYWLSDLFAVYAPFTGAALLWVPFRHTCSFVGFVLATWLPPAVAR